MKNAKIVFCLVVALVVVFIGLRYFNHKKVEIQTIQDSSKVLDIKPEVVFPKYLAPQKGLPPLVEAKRQAIYKAALTRNYDNLKKEAGPEFKDGFGLGFDPWKYDQNQSKKMFDNIPALLGLPYQYDTVDTANKSYIWPSFWDKKSKDWTVEDVANMKKFLTDEEIETYRKGFYSELSGGIVTGYNGYRIAISPKGEWTLYYQGQGD